MLPFYFIIFTIIHCLRYSLVKLTYNNYYSLFVCVLVTCFVHFGVMIFVDIHMNTHNNN